MGLLWLSVMIAMLFLALILLNTELKVVLRGRTLRTFVKLSKITKKWNLKVINEAINERAEGARTIFFG